MESESLASRRHTSVQIPKVKGLQSAYMAAPFGTFGAKSLDSRQDFSMLKMKIQILIKKPNFFPIKYSKPNKRIVIIYFNGLLPLPLERSLDDKVSTYAT